MMINLEYIYNATLLTATVLYEKHADGHLSLRLAPIEAQWYIILE